MIVKDIYGNEIKEGDYIAYACSRKMMHKLIVYKVTGVKAPVVYATEVGSTLEIAAVLGNLDNLALKLEGYVER